MKSNKARFLFFPLLLVIAFIGAIIFLWSGQKEKTKNKRADALKPSVKATVSTPLVGGNAINQSGDPIYEKTKAYRELKLKEIANTPIDFFGQVVDENGNPVEGASTFYIVANLSFYGSPTITGPKTDSGGRFSITGKRGPDFSVWVEHPDYYKTESADKKIEYARRDYMPGKEPPLPPTLNSPAIFVLKKKGVPEPLVHYGELKIRLPFNGNPISIDTRTGRIGQGNESVVITLQSEGDTLPINTFYPFNWSVTIQVPGGGLVERSDAFNFQAPVDGYLPKMLIKMPASLSRDEWNSEIQKDFFVSFASGNSGRVRLDISGEKGRCIAETFLNPKTGSRNLEFDPAKAVKSP